MKAPLALLCLAPVFAFAQAPSAFTLPNGLKVILFEDHSLPLVRGDLRLDLPSPARDAEAWLRPLGFRMLAAGGSGTRTAAAFALAADSIGLDLVSESGPDAATWRFATRSQDQETALALLADRVSRPAFDPVALETARLAAWGELAEANALSRARLRFQRSLDGLPEPDERALGAVDAQRLAAWHHRLFRPDRATLVLWGDLDASQARQLAILTFGAWTPQDPGKDATTPPPPEAGPFLAALPGEAPAVSLGLAEDPADLPARRFLKPWLASQVNAAGFDLEAGSRFILRADAPLGTSAESLRARLAVELDSLPSAFTAEDLASLQKEREAQDRLIGLHPAALMDRALVPSHVPKDLAEAKAILARWCAPENRRLLVSGDPGALQGLQAPGTTTPKR